jgi:hypothetical protein
MVRAPMGWLETYRFLAAFLEALRLVAFFFEAFLAAFFFAIGCLS